MEGSLDYSGLGVGDIIEKNLSTADILEFFQIIGKLSISKKIYLGIIEKLLISKNVPPISSDKLN